MTLLVTVLILPWTHLEVRAANENAGQLRSRDRFSQPRTCLLIY